MPAGLGCLGAVIGVRRARAFAPSDHVTGDNANQDVVEVILAAGAGSEWPNQGKPHDLEVNSVNPHHVPHVETVFGRRRHVRYRSSFSRGARARKTFYEEPIWDKNHRRRLETPPWTESSLVTPPDRDESRRLGAGRPQGVDSTPTTRPQRDASDQRRPRASQGADQPAGFWISPGRR